MLFVPAAIAEVLMMPPETPIACQVCKHDPALTFAGMVTNAEGGRLGVFDGKAHQTVAFTVPADFRGVSSSDGVIKNGPLSSARPGLLARVTYQAIGGKNVVSQVLLLTLNQCRALIAAAKLSGEKNVTCPD
jgi:hypothetical protein